MTTCDYHDWPLENGWHIGPADPEGIEGIQRVPCAYEIAKNEDDIPAARQGEQGAPE